jgi:hypothetical protein
VTKSKVQAGAVTPCLVSITVLECSIGSGMMFVELRRTRTLSEGNSLFVLSMESNS